MQIPPQILIPSAAVAVVIVICLVRLIAGKKDARLSEQSCRGFLATQAPESDVAKIEINDNNKLALAYDASNAPIYLIRSFGDKMVLQSLSEADVIQGQGSNGLLIKRQDIAHPPVHFIKTAVEG